MVMIVDHTHINQPIGKAGRERTFRGHASQRERVSLPLRSVTRFPRNLIVASVPHVAVRL